MENYKDLLGEKSMLNVEAQKELIDHTIEASTKNALKIFAIVFPIMIIFILGTLFAVFYFVGVIK
jgi:hypothetical protein